MKLIFSFVVLWSFASFSAYYDLPSQGHAENCYPPQTCEQSEKVCVYPSDEEALEQARLNLEVYDDIFACTLITITLVKRNTSINDGNTCYQVDISARFRCRGRW